MTAPNPADERARRIYAGVPALIAIYGEPGTGKTTDELYSFPRGYFVAAKGALKPSVSVVGYVPPMIAEPKSDAIEDVWNLDTVLARLKADFAPYIGKGAKPCPYDAIVLDDFTQIVERTRRVMEPKFKDPRQMYPVLASKALDVAAFSRTVGCHTVFNCHIKYPKDDEMGGPALPGQMLGAAFLRDFDMALRADPDPLRKPWPACYRAGLWAGGEWRTKDRHHVVIDRAPMNLAEILRAAGYAVARPAGFEWMEQAVEQLSASILGGGVEITVLTDAIKLMRENAVPDPAIAWVLRDARDRVEITKLKKSAHIARFGFGS